MQLIVAAHEVRRHADARRPFAGDPSTVGRCGRAGARDWSRGCRPSDLYSMVFHPGCQKRPNAGRARDVGVPIQKIVGNDAGGHRMDGGTVGDGSRTSYDSDSDADGCTMPVIGAATVASDCAWTVSTGKRKTAAQQIWFVPEPASGLWRYLIVRDYKGGPVEIPAQPLPPLLSNERLLRERAAVKFRFTAAKKGHHALGCYVAVCG
jgi:hypothetical protein